MKSANKKEIQEAFSYYRKGGRIFFDQRRRMIIGQNKVFSDEKVFVTEFFKDVKRVTVNEFVFYGNPHIF